MAVSASKYRKRVEEHLRRYRPKEYRTAKGEGTLQSWVDNLAAGIAEWVNTQVPPEMEGQSSTNTRERETSLAIAESEALREYLPRDENEGRIGPSGGYED